jgi:F420-dependent methylenetetrahydromethanopterin dehydrogenase
MPSIGGAVEALDEYIEIQKYVITHCPNPFVPSPKRVRGDLSKNRVPGVQSHRAPCFSKPFIKMI